MDPQDEFDLPEARWNRLPEPDKPDLPDMSWNAFRDVAKPVSAWPRRLAAALSMVLVVPLVNAMPAYAAPRSAPAVQKETPVKGTSVPVQAPEADPVAERAWKAAPAVTWPKPQKAELGSSKAPAGFPVHLAADKSGNRSSDQSGDPVSVELLDTDRLGLALRVSPGQGVAAARAGGGKTELKIDYSGFRYAYGGDYGARLGMVKLAECALQSATATAECPQPEPVRSSNDPKTGTLSAEVETGAVYALAAAPSGQSGDHSATSLSASSDWSVGTQTGDFSWSYDLRTPPALGGEEPELSLSYSSQSVDGRTASTNNQASWAGDGFEFSPGGYIERRYKSCMIDGKKTGDLCWDQENAVLSLGGSSIELVKDATSRQWRPKRDDGTRIELLTGATNGDNNGEYWRVT
ncbi:hypothetical protein B0I32_14219, partial [Nonomuraea fuscirosea]